MNKIMEKRVKLPTDVITFIKTSGVISKYQARFQQSFKSPVSLEVGSDLVLSSLSSGALDEALAAIERDLSLDIVQLQGAAAVPPHLDRMKEILYKAKNEVNCGEFRVDFSFISAVSGTALTKVRLVGYSENVNKLKEVLHDNEFNHHVIDLSPDLVDCFYEILDLVEMKQPEVTLKASHFPHPCVRLSGPRCLVREAQTNLKATLASLTIDTLVLDGSGAQRYFEEDGKLNKELVESSCHVIIRKQRSVKTKPLSTRSPISITPRSVITTGHLGNIVGNMVDNKTNLKIKLGCLEDEQHYQDIYRHLSLNMKQGGQVIFRSLNSDLDEISISVGGGVKIQLAFGDISNETTDVVVNTTGFTDFETDSVCKDILTKAGPQVEAILKTAKVNRGEVFKTQAGSFPCRSIFHVCGQQDAGIIEILVCRIIRDCESSRYTSVAIPAICAGVGGLDPDVVAQAILRGIKTTTSSTPLHFVTNIRLVLNKINVFMAFKQQTTHMFPHAVISRVSVSQLRHVPQQRSTRLINTNPIITATRTGQQQRSVFIFVGLVKKNVEDAKTKLKDVYQAQCSTHSFTKEQLTGLTKDDLKGLEKTVEAEGLCMQRDQFGSLTVSGLKHGVNQVKQMVQTTATLRREMRAKEEEDLYTCVTWCILGHSGKWERLPKTANYNLEKSDVTGGIVDAQGISWSVDLQRIEAKRHRTGQTAKLKRLENLPDLMLPLYWDNMKTGEYLRVVSLESTSAEYQTVKQDFRRTVTRTIMKIERLQNVHLLRAYEVQKKHITDKTNLQGGALEKSLYHGTTQDNCDSIIKTGFNRSFAGQNATAYGHGTYFAVNASYSASPTYSKPAADGSQLMFVARVLTGTYTVGGSNMKVPPPRNVLQPHDLYDSVVDNIHNPSMYVVFHDNQAYPDYLITFK
ncbi:protein mono-ADP-ribosyltransferase PARP14-like [Anabas testudineus]|uniref:protein mono-ADP-ribosyltransferase PARP14-like n=1 Tax=Anabas testudineus TaxID=64144 RepID=UPI000E45DD61|nr:protein mono-ADP-ribosyltransferase PARP14-like [Anabas testudineus]